jgi:hypothetical protein
MATEASALRQLVESTQTMIEDSIRAVRDLRRGASLADPGGATGRTAEGEDTGGTSAVDDGTTSASIEFGESALIGILSS